MYRSSMQTWTTGTRQWINPVTDLETDGRKKYGKWGRMMCDALAACPASINMCPAVDGHTFALRHRNDFLVAFAIVKPTV